MKKGFWGFGALGFMLAAFLLAAVPAWAQSVDDKIKALEQELGQLKSQQVELKKEATAAAAALPSFSYRPGNGVNIEAADKSWGIRFGIEAHLRALFESGQDQVGRTNGEVMLRRWRPSIFYCIDNCLYEIEMSWDMDGFGTGNAKDSTGTATGFYHAARGDPFSPRELEPLLADDRYRRRYLHQLQLVAPGFQRCRLTDGLRSIDPQLRTQHGPSRLGLRFQLG